MKEFDRILQKVQPIKEKILNHQVFNEVENVDDLNTFLQYNVFAVWEYMSVLKALQKDITSVSTPWIPKRKPASRKYVNELVNKKENNVVLKGEFQSEYEVFLNIMNETNADTNAIERLVSSISRGENIFVLIDELEMPKVIRTYLDYSFKLIDSKETHKIAAALIFGRESLVPAQFIKVVENINKKFPVGLDSMLTYLKENTGQGKESYDQAALSMIQELCGVEEDKWDDVVETAEMALNKKLQLLDGLKEDILNQRNMATAV